MFVSINGLMVMSPTKSNLHKQKITVTGLLQLFGNRSELYCKDNARHHAAKKTL